MDHHPAAAPSDPAPSDRAPVRAALRRETRAAHERLESWLPLASPALTRAAYLDVLVGYHQALRVLEPRLGAHGAAFAAWEVDWPARRKLALLERDLVALGHRLDPDAPSPCAAGPAGPALHTLAAAFGCLYVVEGATLGGVVIARNVERVLGLDATTGNGFFSGCGALTATRWRALLAILERALAPAPALADAITAANDTFAFFAHHLGGTHDA